MRSLKRIWFIFTVLVFSLAACGPSPEQVATLTASAWTPTPVPTDTPVPTATATPLPTNTPTATPLPISLAVKIVDAGGSPVPGASIAYPESGAVEPFFADEAGQYSWSDLPTALGTLYVTAQGYLKAEQKLVLDRGSNEVTVTLQRDPYGLLASTACGPGETPLLLEDFQNGETHFAQAAPGGRPADLVPAPDDPANTVLIHDMDSLPRGEELSTYLRVGAEGERVQFGDSVWRMRLYLTVFSELAFFWQIAPPYERDGVSISESSYNFGFTDQRRLFIRRMFWDSTGKFITVGKDFLFNGAAIITPEAWHYLEISTYQGSVQVWLDGEQIVAAEDVAPLPPGGMNIQGAGKGLHYFDAISVCRLSAPFVSIASPVPVVVP